jgi:hypothetical protein
MYLAKYTTEGLGRIDGEDADKRIENNAKFGRVLGLAELGQHVSNFENVLGSITADIRQGFHCLFPDDHVVVLAQVQHRFHRL